MHLGAGHPLAGITLAHIDNQFVYPGDGDYQGLFVEHELTEQVFELLPAVPELLPGAKAFVDSLAYPRFYLDFETVGPAIPRWRGTRPYQVLPFQWSCHIERAPGVMEHAEFLDLSGAPPMRALAEKMIADLESSGPVLMYTSYERGVIEGLSAMFPDLANALQAIIGRLVGFFANQPESAQ